MKVVNCVDNVHISGQEILKVRREYSGTILYQGPSTLDGQPIVVIATWNTRNTKTGPMVQTWIIRSDLHPVGALGGADYSICGNCPLRPANGGRCYVVVVHAPRAIYEKFQNGGYPTLEEIGGSSFFRGDYLRIGAYGDPAAVPLGVWQPILPHVRAWTGYTHQWRTCDSAYRAFLMASVDTKQEATEAQALGWRYFRVAMLATDRILMPGETNCPASAEMGKRSTCQKCKLCSGTGGRHAGAKNIMIYKH